MGRRPITDRERAGHPGPGRDRAIGYVRVSTDKQAEHGMSLDAQREKIEVYAKLFNLTIAEVIVDAGASAASLNRPGLDRALAMLKSGEAYALLVVKLDRLTRSVRDLGDLVEGYFGDGNAALLSVSEQIDTRSAAGRLVLNVLTSVAQWEREAVSERTSQVMQHMRAHGSYTGGRAPYGFKLEGDRLVPVEEEQHMIEAATRARAEGLSLRAVAARLERDGFKTRGGGTFAPAQVACVLKARIAA